MKKILLVLISTFLLFTSCENTEKSTSKVEDAVVFGTSLTALVDNSNINVIGTTTDALESGIIDNIEDVGTLMNPNMETILELNPDVVILSGRSPKFEDVKSILEGTEIEVLELEYGTFEEYKNVVKEIADITNDTTYYDLMVTDNEKKIEDLKSKAKDEDASALILRTSKTTFNVVDNTYFSNEIIEDMNVTNIANVNDRLSANLQMEYILEEDPDYIFIIPMGDDSTSNQGYEAFLSENEAWSSLSAVKSGNVHHLPKELFHIKPNEKWSDAYEYIYEILQQ